MLDTRRREFIALIGGGCLLLAVKGAWGQQPAMPVIGFLTAHLHKSTSRSSMLSCKVSRKRVISIAKISSSNTGGPTVSTPAFQRCFAVLSIDTLQSSR
jgi:hypothetical protein